MTAPPADLLMLVRDFTLRVRSGEAELEGPAGRANLRLEGLLELLLAFEQPASTAAVLARLPAKGASDWAEHAASLRVLRKAGILASPEERAQGAVDPKRRGFAAPGLQSDMLHDEQRVFAFLKAIAEVVRPGDVVVDLGTGSGVLAVAAARAGARHVYAIEESSIGDIAEDVFAKNGVADRVTLVRGHSTRVSLPERCDVLVSETLGNDPLDELIVVYLEDARRRLLKDHARLIPSNIEVVVQAVEAPLARTPVLDDAAIERWKAAYGIDLAPLAARRGPGLWRFSDEVSVLSTFAKCSEAKAIDRIDLGVDGAATLRNEVRLIATRAARHVGLSLGYDARLSENVVLQVGAHARELCPSWRYGIWTKLEPMAVAVGDALDVELERTRTACHLTLRLSSGGAT